MATPLDVIVIGSGFGGAITARRLGEKGVGVLVLGRGSRQELLQIGAMELEGLVDLSLLERNLAQQIVGGAELPNRAAHS